MKSYEIKFRESFIKDLKKLDGSVQRLVLKYIKTHLDQTSDPKAKGEPLKWEKKGFWRYRIGDYRLIAEINDNELIILCLTIGHRKNVYRG